MDFWLPKDYISKNSGMLLMLDFTKNECNKLWDSFSQIENYYKVNLFEYSILKIESTYLYTELCNKEVVSEFNLDEIDVNILVICNENVVDLNIIISVLKTSGFSVYVEDLKEKILDLKNAHLLYATIDFMEIVSIINPNVIF